MPRGEPQPLHLLPPDVPPSFDHRLPHKSHLPPHSTRNSSHPLQLGKTQPPASTPRSASTPDSDLTIFVGKNRTPYTLSIHTLRGSSYFRSLFDGRVGDPSLPIVIDCEESVFQNMMTILRYGSFAALPKMSGPEMFKLRLELEFYGIEVADSPSKSRSSSTVSSPASMSPRAPSESGNARHFPLTELSDFPADLTDPAKLVLVSRLDNDVRARCPCSAEERPSLWALNFHHRHAFCTACGRPPSSMAPKFLAEMFMVATAYFAGDKLDPKKWSVGCDSTCTLKFASPNSCCCCSCSSKSSVWAASTYYSHAFCTQCRKCAEGSILLCVLFTLRFGGHHRSPKGRRENHAEAPISRGATTLQPDPCWPPSRTLSYGSQGSG